MVSHGANNRAALIAIASKTGCTLVVERLMTFRTSAVAIWYSSDSVRSRVFACTSLNRWAFWIAMTAWSAKVFSNSIWVSVKPPRSRLPWLAAAHQRYQNCGFYRQAPHGGGEPRFRF